MCSMRLFRHAGDIAPSDLIVVTALGAQCVRLDDVGNRRMRRSACTASCRVAHLLRRRAICWCMHHARALQQKPCRAEGTAVYAHEQARLETCCRVHGSDSTFLDRSRCGECGCVSVSHERAARPSHGPSPDSECVCGICVAGVRRTRYLSGDNKRETIGCSARQRGGGRTILIPKPMHTDTPTHRRALCDPETAQISHLSWDAPEGTRPIHPPQHSPHIALTSSVHSLSLCSHTVDKPLCAHTSWPELM